MLDIILLVVGCGYFGVAVVYVRACDKL